MLNAFLQKLSQGVSLTPGDVAQLSGAISTSRSMRARQDVIHEGEAPSDVHLVVEGIACRYKMTPNGQRQIMALLLPGDFCDLHVAILGAMDHSIATLTPCRVVDLPRDTIEGLLLNPRIARALWWATLVDEAVLREWLVSMGKRPADQQAAHLFCELHLRLQVAGLADSSSYALPLTQEELGDVLGLSTVHVNRVLQQLRRSGLLGFDGQTVAIHDMEELRRFAGFNPNYLHLKERVLS